jgi:DNA (cytosine-5)-methyltransferase 1
MIKIIEAFSGIGSQSKALNNLKIEYDVVSTIEWDIHAIFAYDLIHNGKQVINPYDE